MVLLAAAKTNGMFLAITDLDRETSQNLELGGTIKRDNWSFEGAVFLSLGRRSTLTGPIKRWRHMLAKPTPSTSKPLASS